MEGLLLFQLMVIQMRRGEMEANGMNLYFFVVELWRHIKLPTFTLPIKCGRNTLVDCCWSAEPRKWTAHKDESIFAHGGHLSPSHCYKSGSS